MAVSLVYFTRLEASGRKGRTRPLAAFGDRNAVVTASSSDTTGRLAPELSVVVIVVAGAATLARCLDALAGQAHAAAMDTIVVFDEGDRDVRSLGLRFAPVQWLAVPTGTTVPHMRARGLARARAPIVALLEDDCLVEPGWSAAVQAAHATRDAAIGGAVEPGPYRRGLDWAVYFCEYGRFMAPFRPGADVLRALAGNHVTYKREALAATDLSGADGFVDVFVHAAWQRAGVPLRVDETLVVRNVNRWSPADVTVGPFHHGRAFAAQRARGQSLLERVARCLAASALPAVLAGRIIRDAASTQRFVWRLVPAFPWIVLFVTSWSIGEAVGYLSGPGQSPAYWRPRARRPAKGTT